MKRTRRNHGAAFKAQVACAAVRGDKTLAELATQFRVHPTQIAEWQPHVLARAVDVFGGTKSPSDVPDLKVLHAKIGQLALEHAVLEGALIKAGLLSAKRCSRAPTHYRWCGNASSWSWRAQRSTRRLVRYPPLIWRECAGSTRCIWPRRLPEPGCCATCCGATATGLGVSESAP